MASSRGQHLRRGLRWKHPTQTGCSGSNDCLSCAPAPANGTSVWFWQWHLRFLTCGASYEAGQHLRLRQFVLLRRRLRRQSSTWFGGAAPSRPRATGTRVPRAVSLRFPKPESAPAQRRLPLRLPHPPTSAKELCKTRPFTVSSDADGDLARFVERAPSTKASESSGQRGDEANGELDSDSRRCRAVLPASFQKTGPPKRRAAA
jgi:hypothetical protein